MLGKSEPEISVGIDFGTSNSCSGVYINGVVKIVPNKIGERITPSIVLFKTNKKKDQNNKEVVKEEILVGEEALCEPIGNIRNYIYEIKRFIGLDYEELEESGFKESLNYEIVNDDGIPKVKIEFNGQYKYYTIEEISAIIIKKIIQSTEDFIAEILDSKGLKIKNAVFTVPSQFTDQQKKSILDAAKLAGIEVPRIINEPTAAALAYGIGKDLTYSKKNSLLNSTAVGVDYDVAPSANQFIKSEEKVMIFDLGGGTLDITILNINKNQDNSLNFDVLVTRGDIHLGGSDFDKILMDNCIKIFCEDNNINKDDLLKDYRACRRLKIKCENAKKLLTLKNNVVIQIDNFYQENDLFMKIRQNEFSDICNPLYERIKSKVIDVLNEENLTANDIEKVILVGGGTRIHGIKNLLKKIFGENKIKDDINPEEAVAIGATLDAAKLQIQHKMNFTLQDIIPYNIGMAVQNPNPNDIYKEIMHPIIKKYSKIPSSKEKRYKANLSDINPDIVVNVYEGNNQYIKNNVKLGGAIISGLKKRGDVIYKVTLNVAVNGKLTGYIQSDELNINQEINFKVRNTIGYAFGHKIKIARNVNLETLASVGPNIQKKKDIIGKSQDIIIKLNNLIECSKIYEELIKNYNVFVKDNESLYEKIFSYTKELFELYLERIKLKKEDNKQIVQKIKERMMNLIKEQNYIEELMLMFKELKGDYTNEFYLIFCNYMEILNNEALSKLKGGKFSRYFAKLNFEKVFFGIKKYVEEKDLQLIEPEIKKFYDSQKSITEEELKKINTFAFLVEYYAKQKKYLPGGLGFTKIKEKIDGFMQNKEPTLEETREFLDLFHNMADSYEKSEKSIGEAYCLATIIKISFEYLGITDYDRLEIYIERFEFIMEGKEKENYKWYKEVSKIIEKIKPENN
jgi:molecular chaperone DnaK (HSP70)